VPRSLPPLLKEVQLQLQRPTSASPHSPGPGSGAVHAPNVAGGQTSLLVRQRPASASGVRFADDEGP
jgi:hypothetical protein